MGENSSTDSIQESEEKLMGLPKKSCSAASEGSIRTGKELKAEGKRKRKKEKEVIIGLQKKITPFPMNHLNKHSNNRAHMLGHTCWLITTSCNPLGSVWK